MTLRSRSPELRVALEEPDNLKSSFIASTSSTRAVSATVLSLPTRHGVPLGNT